MTERTKIAAAVVVVMCMSFAACGIGADVYRYGDWPGDPALSIGDLNQEMIDTCGLMPADIVMIDLRSQQFQKEFYRNTCDQIKFGLPGYRETYGIQLGSMLSNPAVDTNLPSTHGLQYALFSVSSPGSFVANEVFIDFHGNTVSFGEDISANMGGATVVSLLAEDLQGVLSGLKPLTGWAPPWTQTAEPNGDIGGFMLMVIARDGVLYRWIGLWNTADAPQTIPPDFMTVYDAFMGLIKR